MGRVVPKRTGPKYGFTARRGGGDRVRSAGSQPVAIYEAASNHPLIPRVQDPSPSVTARQQRYMQLLSRHMYRNDSLIRNLVNAAGRLHIGTGPVPISRFPELDDLWLACADQFDNTGRRSFGGWLRQDIYRNHRIDGEVFVRRRDRIDAPEEENLLVPVEFEAHTTEFVDMSFTQVHEGLNYVCGVASVRSKPVRYAMFTEQPQERHIFQRFYPGADEVYHIHDALTGSPRGEVMLASALLRAIKTSSLEDAELRRKQVAALSSIGIERPLDDMSEDFQMPDEDEIGAMIDSIQLAPGGIFQLPVGHKLTSFTPADQPGNFEAALRWQLMCICASVGIPAFEVTGEGEVERMGRLLSQRMQSQAELEHEMLEHQLLNRMRRDFIDYAMMSGLWSPPRGVHPWEIYRCEWQWPIIPAARMDQELRVLMDAADRGHIEHGYVARTIFGKTPEQVARASARDLARGQALGLTYADEGFAPTTDVARRIADDIYEEEVAERDLVDAARLEDAEFDDEPGDLLPL